MIQLFDATPVSPKVCEDSNPFGMWIWEEKNKTKQGYGGECIQRNTGCTERSPGISNL